MLFKVKEMGAKKWKKNKIVNFKQEILSLSKNLSSFSINSPYLILFILFYSSFTFAAECGLFGNYLRNGVCVPDYLINLSTIIMLISLTIASIFYMVGISLDHTRIKEWSKDLLYQLLGSALILSVYLTIASSLDFWAPALLGSNLAFPTEGTIRAYSQTSSWQNLHGHVTNYINCLINYTKDSIKSIAGMTSALSVLGSTSIQLQVAGWSEFYPVFPTGGGVGPLASIVIGALSATLIQLRLQLAILDLNSALFSLILPLGLIFRSFPYTRSAGAAMIAIVFGFTIFLPVFYLIIEDIGYKYYPVDVCNKRAPSISFFQLVGIGFKTAQKGALYTLQKYFGSDGEFEGLIKIMVIQATILPLVAYLVVLNITKRIAEILGGEIDFSTLVRLI